MIVKKLAQNIGKGHVAGLAGTVAMTASSTVEQRLRKRKASNAPAAAAEKLLGIESFESTAAENRFSNLVHWGYGTGWGAMHGFLRTIGLPPAAAVVGHYAGVWGGAQVILPALDVAPPITKWGGEEIAIDAWHHVAYTVVTGVAYSIIDRGGLR
jgi:hypothetical protein